MKLNEKETLQLFILLKYFAEGWQTDFTVFRKNGPSRKLAKKITEEIAPFAEITITQHKKN